MNFENPFKKHDDSSVEKETSIDSTSSFKEAVDAGNLAQAEDWLDQAQNEEKYDDRWLDHRQRELFRAYYQIKDWVGAKRIVEKTKDPDSKAGRITRLEELSGLKYDEI